MRTKVELEEALMNMDIPLFRSDLSKFENVEWLLRNLGIRNQIRPNFQSVLLDLKTFKRGFFK